MKKVLYIVLDGLGDLPNPLLNGKTPLEAASTPNLDNLARLGKTGLMYTVGKGIAPESDVAVISLLGYDAHKYYTGRGPLECYAAGIKIKDGELALRVNFATLGEGRNIKDRRVGRNLTTEEAQALARSVNEKVKLTDAEFIFKSTIGHRGVLMIRSLKGRLSDRITNTDPAYDKHDVFGVAKEKFENVVLDSRPEAGFESNPSAQAASGLLNEFTRKSTEVLNEDPVNRKRISEGKMPANLILSRDPGASLPKFPPFPKVWGMNFACFVEMPVEQGIALLTGMEIVDLPRITGDSLQDYSIRADKAIESIKKYDGLYIHLKGPDEPAHDGDAEKKKRSIEDIDRYFFASLLPRIDLHTTIVAVTSDHSTPCILKAHSDDPVPLLIAGSGVKHDGSNSFGEGTCRSGNLGTIKGTDLMPMLVKLARG